MIAVTHGSELARITRQSPKQPAGIPGRRPALPMFGDGFLAARDQRGTERR